MTKFLKGLKPNRVAVYMTALAALLTALAPVVADLKTTSVVSLVAGLAAVVKVVDTWLKGWQRYEADARFEEQIQAEAVQQSPKAV